MNFQVSYLENDKSQWNSWGIACIWPEQRKFNFNSFTLCKTSKIHFILLWYPDHCQHLYWTRIMLANQPKTIYCSKITVNLIYMGYEHRWQCQHLIISWNWRVVIMNRQQPTFKLRSMEGNLQVKGLPCLCFPHSSWRRM